MDEIEADAYLGDDLEVEDEYKQEFSCPFCAEEFDIVGLFCHMDDEHQLELRNGVIFSPAFQPASLPSMQFDDFLRMQYYTFSVLFMLCNICLDCHNASAALEAYLTAHGHYKRQRVKLFDVDCWEYSIWLFEYVHYCWNLINSISRFSKQSIEMFQVGRPFVE